MAGGTYRAPRGVGGVKTLEIGDPGEPSLPVARFPAQLAVVIRNIES
jgi:hypothetical protein